MRDRFTTAIGLCAVSLAFASSAAFAFDNPLSADAIREAYFIATGSPGKRNDFFARYTHHPPAPKTGPAVSTIQIQTPFAAVVQDISDHSVNIHAPDAVQQYYGKAAHFRVVVTVAFTATYPPSASSSMQLGDFWDKFHIHLRQAKQIAALSVQGKPIMSTQTRSGYIGATIVANYNPDKIQSGPATVIVTGPDDARTEASFDLSALR